MDTDNRPSKSIQKYLDIIKNTQELSKEQELECVRRAKRNKKYKNWLFEAHLKMVLGIANKYANGHSETLEDLVQEGIKGLDKALKLFEPKKKVRFNTYARWWVRAFILKYFGENIRGFKVPDN